MVVHSAQKREQDHINLCCYLVIGFFVIDPAFSTGSDAPLVLVDCLGT